VVGGLALLRKETMALGTITNIPLAQGGVADALGSVKMTVTTVVGDGAYSAGGTALTGQQLGLPNGVVLATVCSVSNAVANAGSQTNALASNAFYNTSTGKLQMYAGAGTTPNFGLNEATGNLSATTVTIIAFGY